MFTSLAAYKSLCSLTAQCMTSGGIWGICLPPPIHVGACPQIGTKVIYCLKLDMQSYFHHLQHTNLCTLDSTLNGFWLHMGNMLLTPYSSGGVTQDSYRDHLLSKVRYTI